MVIDSMIVKRDLLRKQALQWPDAEMLMEDDKDFADDWM